MTDATAAVQALPIEEMVTAAAGAASVEQFRFPMIE